MLALARSATRSAHTRYEALSDRMQAVLGCLIMALVATVVAVGATAGLMVHEAHECAAQGGSWTLEMPEAVSTCHYGTDWSNFPR